MPTAQQQREKLVRLLKELFQLDQPDLDFGFYRIMHAKSAQVSAFLDKDLLAIVEDAFGKDSTAKRAELEQAYQTALETAKKYGAADPEEAQPVKQAKAALNAAADTAGAEADVYDHLYRFFERYYDSGDFLSRRYLSAETGSKAAAFAVPYDGREVYLHWANADQYYIKTSEYFTNFTFDPTQAQEVQTAKGTLFDGKDAPALKVHFRIVEATEGEHGNVKATEQQKRFFLIHAADPITIENGELVVRFEFRPDLDKSGQDRTWQDKRSTEAVETVLAALDKLQDTAARQYAAALRTPAPTDKQKDRPLLARYVAQYTARNTMDYFIHKNLGGFLRRELDFYIKNEVMRLDDIESADAPAVETYLGKVKVLRAIAHQIIDFLAQIEDFQKMLFEKKKLITETQYCITVGNIDNAFYEDIAACEPQWDEWKDLFHIDEEQRNLFNAGAKNRKDRRVAFLKQHPTLVLDTKHFDQAFRDRLLAGFDDLDGMTGGVLIHSENFQALNLLLENHRAKVACIYIDPPYNTGSDEFLYRDNYQHSSWLSMMDNRLRTANVLLAPEGLVFVHIDEREQARLDGLMREIFGAGSSLGPFIWLARVGKAVTERVLQVKHEYVMCARRSDTARLKLVENEITGCRYKDERGGYNREQLRQWGGQGDRREDRPTLYFPIPSPFGVDVYPKRPDGPDGRWRASLEQVQEMLAAGDLDFVRDEKTGEITVYRKIREGTVTVSAASNILDDCGTSATATTEIKALFLDKVFDTAKPVSLAKRCISLVAENSDGVVCDYFAGSGTTAHAVINLNREDGGSRKFILVEMGEYFDTVLLPRIKKVTFSPEWKNGKPVRQATAEEAECGPRIVKYIRLESYEDALNNLAFAEDTEREKALAANAGLRQDYMLHYMLDVETRGSASLLNIDAFADPTAYKLKVKKPGSDEYVWKNVDLIETFNYLIGLRVEHMAAPQTFTANFKREKDPELPKDTNTKLVLDGKLKQDANGPWWFRRVEGWLPQGTNDGREKVLIIWRRLTGDIEQDNLMLDEYFQAHRLSTRDWEFDTIYVNGSNNLPNLKRDDDTWKVRLIEEDFHRLMWDVQDI